MRASSSRGRTVSERRPPIGPVLSGVATLLAEWWLGYDVTEASRPSDDCSQFANGTGGSDPLSLGDVIRRAGEDQS